MGTLVDAKHVEQHLDEEKPEGAENELTRVEKRIKSINSFAPIFRTQHSKISVDNVLDIRGFDLKRTLEMDPEFLNTDNEHEHDNTVSSLCIIQDGDVDFDMVQTWV